MRFDPDSKAVSEFRRYTNRVNGLGLRARRRALRRAGRRAAARRVHARRTGHRRRCAARRQVPQPAVRPHRRPASTASGSPIRAIRSSRSARRSFPARPASVLRLRAQRSPRLGARRASPTTPYRRARCCCRRTRRRCMSPTASPAPGSGGNCAPIRSAPTEASAASRVLHMFGADHRGPHRGIEGMCLDADGNIVACAGWQRSGPGPLIYVFSPTRRGDRNPSVPGRSAEQLLFRRRRS